jgi:hypothetical protein
MKVSVNGKPAGVGEPGTYLSLRRKWSTGDTIEFTLPTAIRVKPYMGEDQLPGKSRYSVEYGPILLAAVGSSQIELFVDKGQGAEQLANYMEQIEGSPLHFAVRGNTGQKFIPYWQVSDEEFTCYPVVSSLA